MSKWVMRVNKLIHRLRECGSFRCPLASLSESTSTREPDGLQRRFSSMFFRFRLFAPLTKRYITACILILLILFTPAIPMGPAFQEVRLFVVEKSKNPQNILVVYTQADSQCRVEPVASGSKSYLFDFYWLMGGTRYKPTHPLIKLYARRRFVAQKRFENHKGFKVRLADLKELDHDLPSDMVTVTLYRNSKDGCNARVLIPLGPSAEGRTLEIQSIYSKARTLLGIPIGVRYVELKGRDADNQTPLTVRFNSKRGKKAQRP
jgi:hypothetical protein